ncbi:MAG: adenylosuccinate synthase [Polyangia bacterium]|mgnify:CR=1 FL=1|jgi:adenylosuccinate synthase|nr:adenylosuccinate synthase [Polyangia bacterium]
MPNVIVVGAQWGDEGKGKVVDVLTADADLVVRYAGGANAGHTLVVAGAPLVVHLLPSGVTHAGKRCLLGPGMVIDPEALLEELDSCRKRGFSVGPEAIGVSHHAHVILPYHKELDGASDQGPNAIGTTRRGIGPCYEDKMARRGIQMWMLTRPELLGRALEGALAVTNPRLRQLGAATFDAGPLRDRLASLGSALEPYLCDTTSIIHEAMAKGARVLFEGAQGALLDIDHGTYPYVTSSSTVAGGACTGSGVGPTQIHAVIGIAKAYTTRVGNGPFPSELKGDLGEQLRKRGGEHGATTGRPRRCGWLDAVALGRAVRVSGISSLAITKLDVLQGISPIKICVGYRLDGETAEEFPTAGVDLERVEPIYEEWDGFEEDIRGVTRIENLPGTARAYLDRISELAKAPICLVSVGPSRSETILVDNPASPG